MLSNCYTHKRKPNALPVMTRESRISCPLSVLACRSASCAGRVRDEIEARVSEASSFAVPEGVAHRRKPAVPTNITIVQTHDFVRARSNGELDLDVSRRLLVDVVSAMRKSGEHNVLIDTRAAAPTRLTRTDLWDLAIAAGTQPALSAGRIALLVPRDKQEDAEFFEGVARVEGANVRAFVDFESAISWLIIRTQSAV